MPILVVLSKYGNYREEDSHFFFPLVVLVIISAKAEVTHFAKAASLAKLSLAGRALGFVLQGAKRLTSGGEPSIHHP